MPGITALTLTTETPVAPSSALAEPEAEAVPPVPPVLEEVPASQEPVHVPTPALTADQLAAAARQLQEALVPLTQALTASVAPAGAAGASGRVHPRQQPHGRRGRGGFRSGGAAFR